MVAPELEQFRRRARSWLSEHLRPAAVSGSLDWGRGSDDVAVFHNLTEDAERDLLDEAMAWQRLKFDHGFGAIQWPTDYGGAGLTGLHEEAFEEEQASFETPAHHELFSVTLHLVAPTIRVFGSFEQKRTLIPKFLRTEELCCQLFSEPNAGSDLAGLSTRATPEGDGWIVNGQKTWSSGTRFATWGELVCRTDPTAPKHSGMTAFVIPMDAPGITVVPIRQMSGGASFNEVFFDGVRIDDSLRLGRVGEGWRVALTTLGLERGASGSDRGAQAVGGTWNQLLALARWVAATADPVARQVLARLYTIDQLRGYLAARAAADRRINGVPGPAASLGKLMWTEWLTEVGEAAASLLGARIAADSGEWGTYSWAEHVLGAPGYRIAGGSDEIQRNIIGERVLGLPR